MAVKDPSQMFAGTFLDEIVKHEAELDKLVQSFLTAKGVVKITTAENGKAKCFLDGCGRKIPKFAAKMVELVQSDFDGINRAVTKFYQGLDGLTDFKIALECDKVDAALSAKICGSPNLKPCYDFLSFGVDRLGELKKFLLAIQAAMGRIEFKDDTDFQDVVHKVSATIRIMQHFTDSQPTDACVVLSDVSFAIGNATVAQAIFRDLKTGETRQALVNKALNGTRKRSWKVHASLVSRCNAILAGKPMQTRNAA